MPYDWQHFKRQIRRFAFSVTTLYGGMQLCSLLVCLMVFLFFLHRWGETILPTYFLCVVSDKKGWEWGAGNLPLLFYFSRKKKKSRERGQVRIFTSMAQSSVHDAISGNGIWKINPILPVINSGSWVVPGRKGLYFLKSKTKCLQARF